MSSDELLIFSAFGGMAIFMILAAVGVWLLSRVLKRSTNAGAARDAEARGWQLQVSEEGGAEVRRWRGSTAGVAWTCEYRVTDKRGGTRDYSRHQTRWHAETVNGPSSPILIIPQRSSLKRLESVADAIPAGFLRSLVGEATDKVIDRWFGAEVGAAVDLSSLTPIDGHGVEGATVMAARPTEALLLLRSRVAPVLAAQAAARGSVFSDAEAPAVMLLPRTVHLASRASTSTGDVERLAQAGSALVNALK